MAKNKKDYTKFSNQPEVPVVEPVEAEQVVEETVEAPVEQKTILGIVTDCVKLNVRKNPNLNSDVVTIIDARADVTINEEESTKDFYKIHTASGVNGYCMKKYITIKP